MEGGGGGGLAQWSLTASGSLPCVFHIACCMFLDKTFHLFRELFIFQSGIFCVCIELWSQLVYSVRSILNVIYNLMNIFLPPVVA